MSFDDTAEKVRRNVVILSSAIIIAWFLNLHVDRASKLFGVIELESTPPIKLWGLAIIIMIYVFLRYWFDEKTRSQKNHLYSELSIIKLNILSAYLKFEISQSFKKNKAPPSIHNFEELKKPDLLIRYENQESLSEVNIDLSIERNPESLWSGWVLPDYQLEWDKKHFSTKTGGNRYQFILSNNRRKFLELVSYINLFLYSKSSVDFLIPILLCTISVGICISQLVSIYLKSFN
jgi:hypothetical protein